MGFRIFQHLKFSRIVKFPFSFCLLFFVLLVTSVQSSDKPIAPTMEDIFKHQLFKEKTPKNGKWAEGYFWFIEKDSMSGRNNLLRFQPQTLKSELVVTGVSLVGPDHDSLLVLRDFIVGHTARFLLLFTDTRPLWRENTLGFYYLYERSSGKIFPLSDRSKGYQMFAKFSPDDRRITFVREANLYLYDIDTKSEFPLTTDGNLPDRLNGISDWVYEEEFRLRDGWQWSPDGRFLVFYQFDTTPIPEFLMTDERPNLPENIILRYPQAGGDNSNVRIGIVDLESRSNRYIATGTWAGEKSQFEYIPRVGWTPENHIWIMQLNRQQNHLELITIDPVTQEIRKILSEKSNTWIESSSVFDLSQRVHFLKKSNHFLWASDRDGYNHIYLYRSDGRMVKQITRGKFDLRKLNGLDQEENTLFFTASIENPTEQYLYRTTIYAESEPEQITKEIGTYHSIVSPDGRYFYSNFSTIDSPPVCSIFNAEGHMISVVEDNHELTKRLMNHSRPICTFDTLEARDGSTLYTFMIKPSTFDPRKRYPLLIYTYGGPTAQIVTNAWKGERGMWHNFLTGELPVIVAGIDNRGSINRGKAFLAENYLHLGTVEPEDQIDAARKWGKLTFIDPERIGIWGWSYGGINTLLSMCKFDGPQIFKVGIAVAPVSLWNLYDTIYTERYLRTPQENPGGYFAASPVNYVNFLLPDQKLLLIHGDLDDNVHYQNTVKLIESLQKENKTFHLMIYPGANHSMGKTGIPTTKLHVYRTITNFLKEYL